MSSVELKLIRKFKVGFHQRKFQGDVILILAEKDNDKDKDKDNHLDAQRAFLMNESQVWQTHRALFREIESRLRIILISSTAN